MLGGMLGGMLTERAGGWGASLAVWGCAVSGLGGSMTRIRSFAGPSGPPVGREEGRELGNEGVMSGNLFMTATD